MDSAEEFGLVSIPAGLSPLEIRSFIDQLQEELAKYEQQEMPPRHYFAEGLYAREITIPADTLLVGKIHKHEHLNIISQGDISVLTEDGVKRIRAPFTMVCRPGTKRVGWTHTPTVWTTVHARPKDEQDLERLEEALIAKDYSEVPDLESRAPEALTGGEA